MKKLLLIFLILSIISCGARKVDKNSEVVDTSSKASKWFKDQKDIDFKKIEGVNIITDFTKKTVDNSQETSEETVYELDDSTKVGSITDSNGKKTILDNVKVTTKKSTKKNDIKSEESEKKNENKDLKIDLKKDESSKSKEDSILDSKTEKDNKVIDKEKWSVFNLLWLLIPIAIIVVAYNIYMKYRSKIPF